MPRKRLQGHPGRNTAVESVGGITSSRCTNEEVFIVHEDSSVLPSVTTTSIPARVYAIRPTGYGLKQTLGTSAGTQPFRLESFSTPMCIVVIGANPTEGHPVFASQMKRRLREGAQS